MNASRPDVVFDCNVFLQAISRAQGPAAHALQLVDTNAITLHVSKPVIRELCSTLAYPEIRLKNPQVTDDVIAAFIEHLQFRSKMARNVPSVFHFPRDPDDEPYVDLAAAVRADYLVTRDKDLLSLATDHSIEAKQFRQRFWFLRVLDPVAFLTAIKTNE